jgi:DNA polymerase III delta subunit
MRFDVEKAASHRAVYLGGEEGVYRQRALSALLQATAEEDFDLESFGADEKPPHEWTALAGTAPFLSERRVVVVRNLGRVDPSACWPGQTASVGHPFSTELASLPETSLLVMVLDDETGDDDRRQRTLSRGKAWSRLVAAGKGFVQEFTADAKSLPSVLQQEAKALGKKLSPKAALALADMSGGQLSVASGEIEKLAIYVGDAPEITERDVLSVVTADPDYSVYVLVNSALRGDSGAALNQLRLLVGRNPRPEETVFSRLFPAFSSTLRMVWQARFCIDKRVSPTHVPEDVARWLPERNLTSEPPWRLEQHVKAAQRLSLAQIADCFEEVKTAESSIKGLGKSAGLSTTMELMTLRIAATCRAPGR